MIDRLDRLEESRKDLLDKLFPIDGTILSKEQLDTLCDEYVIILRTIKKYSV